MNAINGLFQLIYIDHCSVKLDRKDIIFGECANLTVFVLSKIYKGRFYSLKDLEIRSRTPINNNFMGAMPR
jgi:hypothetical protein